MVTKSNPSCSHTDWYKSCIHLRSLHVRHFGTVLSYEIKNYGVEVTFNGKTSPLNFMKIYLLVRNLFVGDT